MLTLLLPDDTEVQLEHSLVSLSKWEQIHEKPFFSQDDKTAEDTASYIEKMLLSEAPPGDWVTHLSAEDFLAITEYINSGQTATTFREDKSQRPSREIITNELIYSWMVRFTIPFDPCETWHLNRLMTLIRICGIQQTPPKKMTRSEQAAEYRRLNEERRRASGSSG